MNSLSVFKSVRLPVCHSLCAEGKENKDGEAKGGDGTRVKVEGRGRWREGGREFMYKAESLQRRL